MPTLGPACASHDGSALIRISRLHIHLGRSHDRFQLHAFISKRALFVLTGLAWLHAGIMPIMTYGGFKRMTSFCKTAIPADISDTLESIKDNDEAVKVQDPGHPRSCNQLKARKSCWCRE